jgi:cellulose synthase/poly-beta-1,6-N-acetylglucosamine synthase-like glycosyltransferase
MLLIMVLGILLSALVVPNIVYYVWMKNKAKKDWGLAIDPDFRPKVSLIIATYNEAKVMDKKLKNVQELEYPVDKLEVIIVDSASTDGTLDVCRSFLKKNELRYPVKLLSEEQRLGKSHALNIALQHAKGEIIATSDADSFWESDALLKAVPFFADPSVGAVTGREVLMNLEKNVYTMSEGVYRDFYYTLRLGESKVNSTLIFQGELALYRKSLLDKFEDRPGYSDDIGTVVKMVSKGYRCIFIPEAIFYDTAAYSLSGILELKSRRAQHLIAGLIQALKFKLNKKLVVPSAVVAFNFYMHVVSPLLFVVVTLVGVVAFILYFSVVWFLLLLALPLLVFHKPRSFVISYLTSNLALIIGLVRHLAGRKEATWRKIEEMRIG